jgi:hypothetical protein
MPINWIIAEKDDEIKTLQKENNAMLCLLFKQQSTLKAIFDTFEMAKLNNGNIIQLMRNEIAEVQIVDEYTASKVREPKWYKLANQYPNSSASVGEVVKLSLHGEYCPDQSLRGYTKEEIENNPCWVRIK